MRAKYFIAVCDILGFSDLVRDSDLDAVVNGSFGWFRRALSHSLHKEKFPSEAPPTSDLDRHAKIGVAWFSDTILLYSKTDTDESVQEVLSTVAWLLFETMLQGKTKVRGGFAYGEAYIDPPNSLFVGRPIVEAYNLEQEQQWSGAALAQSAVLRIPAAARTGQYADWWVKPYDVPLKNRETLRTLAVNWNQGIHHPTWRLLWSKDSDDPTAVDWAQKQSICEKFVNTKTFHKLFCSNCGREA
jgi:hypothetical protein